MKYPPLTDLLPHRAPMLLLNGIFAHESAQTVCLALFNSQDVLLLGDGRNLPATLALELVAQTMAVHDGLRRRAENSVRRAADRGYLLGSRRFDLFVRNLPVGEELRILAVGEGPGESGGLVRFTGSVETGLGEVLARGDVVVWEHRPE